MDRPLVAALLPVRNGAAHLDGLLECVARFADVVVALDDGSTDDTRARLAASPLVRRVLENPPRPGYHGWDDAENRQRLLDAAGALDPRWIIFLDADERIPPDDAAALRAFLEQGADPDDAYLFRVHRMIGDLDHYDDAHLWVGRLFAYRPGLVLPRERLHLVPLPASVPRERRRRTTVRIQHLGSIDAHARRARVEKYREADPDNALQRDYTSLLAAPRQVRAWAPRSPHLAVLANARGPATPTRAAGEAPALSAVVICQDDEDRIEAAVRAVVTQEVPEPFEVIVVASGRDRTAGIVRAHFPDVEVIELGQPVLPGVARNVGLRRARGEYVTFPGSHVELRPGALAARLRAHRRGYALVTGSVDNGTDTPAGWAAYFFDNSAVLPARPSGPLGVAPPRCSYPREALVEMGGFPEDLRAGEDTVANNRLFDLGYSVYREQTTSMVHHSPCTTVGELVRRHRARGRAMGRILADEAVDRHRRVTRRMLRFVVLVSTVVRLARTTANVMRWGTGLRLRYVRVLPLVALAALASWAGGCYELARRTTRRSRARTADR